VDVILEGCDWISQFGELPEKRARVYRCIADLVQLQEMAELDHTQPFNANLALMYGAETLQQAQQLLSRESGYFGLNNLGANMEGSEMHKQLLLAYHKVNAKKR